MPLLSVHLITYNNEKHVEQAIRSILEQQVDFDYEIVIGDDCSTDGTLNIVNDLSKLNPPVFNIHQNETRLGILKNFKATLDRCSGTYVFDIAGDDLLKGTDALQKIVDVFKQNPNLGFVDCGFDRLDDITKKSSPFINRQLITAPKQVYKNALLLGKIAPIGHCFNREMLYKNVDFDTYIKKGISIEDYPILVDMAMNCDFRRINESLVIYRVHHYSYSHKKDLNELLSQKEEMKHLFDYFFNKYRFSDKLKSDFYLDYFKQILFYAGYFQNKDLGRKSFNKIKRKSLKDHIHFMASQSKAMRSLISLRKKLT